LTRAGDDSDRLDLYQWHRRASWKRTAGFGARNGLRIG
jgi:hypothetical protein